MQEDLLSLAIVKVKNKNSPKMISNTFTPEEAHRELMPMLDIFDEVDEDTDKRVKFIYESLGENPRDKLMNIYTKLGACPPTERRLDRVYKYCRLQDQAHKAMTRYEQLQGDINAISRR